MKNKGFIGLTVIALGCFIWALIFLGKVGVFSNDSFEDYIEWCAEEVDKTIPGFKLEFIDSGHYVYSNGVKHMYEQRTGQFVKTYKEVVELHAWHDSVIVKPSCEIVIEPRCEPTLSGYQTWKQNK